MSSLHNGQMNPIQQCCSAPKANIQVIHIVNCNFIGSRHAARPEDKLAREVTRSRANGRLTARVADLYASLTDVNEDALPHERARAAARAEGNTPTTFSFFRKLCERLELVTCRSETRFCKHPLLKIRIQIHTSDEISLCTEK